MIRDTSATDIVIDRAPEARRIKRRNLVIGAAVVVALALVWPALSRWSSAERSVNAATLRLATVTRGRFVSDVSVQGRVTAAVSPTLYATTAGTVTLKVQAGDKVEKGQLLAIVDSPERRSEYERELSTLQTIEVAFQRQRIETKTQQLANQQAVDLAKVTLDAAVREVARYKDSFDQGVISRQDYERHEDALAEAKVRSAAAIEQAKLADERLVFELKTRELEVQRQRAVVAEVKREVDELSVRAPVAGMVGSLAVQQKAAVATNAPLLTVVDLSLFEVELAVPESYAGELALGMPAEIAYGGAQYPGKLTAVSPEVRDGQVTARVRFAGTMPADLRQNQRVSVRVVLAEKESALLVDRGPFLESGAGRVAYVVHNGIATRTPIEVGATSIGAVEVLQGLQEGDQIIISSTEGFGDAATVLIND